MSKEIIVLTKCENEEIQKVIRKVGGYKNNQNVKFETPMILYY